MNKHTVLVDGDIVVYRCGFAAEHTRYIVLDEEGRPMSPLLESAVERNEFIKEHELEKGSYTVETYKDIEPVSHALANVKSVMETVSSIGDKVHVFLSQGECYRNDIATLKVYKGNRLDAVKPVHYDAIREYLVDRYGAVVFQQLEADDALALCQTDKTVIASIDKDLLQVPGLHFNWVNETKEPGTGKIKVSPEVALRKLYQQVLTGDGTDNIPGIYRVGIVTARALIAECQTEDDMYRLCWEQWEKYLLSDLQKPRDDMAYDSERNFWSYPHCVTGETVEKNSEDIMLEVKELVTVGGTYANQIAEKTGEGLLLPR